MIREGKHMENLMQGKNVFITGGTRGIGYATAQVMLRHGATVAICGSRMETVEKALAQLKEEFSDASIEGYAPDLCNEAEVGATLKDFIAKHDNHLDAVCHIAGITHNNTIKNIPDGLFQHVMDVNLLATYNIDRQAALIMRQQRYGSIVNTASVAGIYGHGMGAAYGASKAGVIGLTKSLGRELGYFNVRVNCVAPGSIKTDMTAGLSPEAYKAACAGIGLRRLGEPEEVANMFLFLASDLSTYCTAAVYQVDGFYT